MTMKVMTIVGTRPEIIKLCRVIMNLTSTLTMFWSIPAKIMTTN